MIGLLFGGVASVVFKKTGFLRKAAARNLRRLFRNFNKGKIGTYYTRVSERIVRFGDEILYDVNTSSYNPYFPATSAKSDFVYVGQGPSFVELDQKTGFLVRTLKDSEIKAYQEIAQWGPDEISQLSSRTGMPKHIIRNAHRHMFKKRHTFSVDGVKYSALFTPEEGIAQLWNKTLSGYTTPVERSAFLELVAHEYIESWVEIKKGLNYHNYQVKDKIANPIDGPTSAHFFAPRNARVPKEALGDTFDANKFVYDEGHELYGMFGHYVAYGLKYEGPRLAKDLSNIDIVIKYMEMAYEKWRRGDMKCPPS
jgi:hypothetical protein